MLEATPEMAGYCFAVIRDRLQKQKSLPPVPSGIPKVNCPIFVCLKTLDGDLRGCIGNFSSSPLHDQLSRYAIASAFEDSRFDPVKESELPHLKCTVSLLHSFEPASRWDDWVIGTHGIRIKYKTHEATFLPSVASEQGWNHKDTLEHLLRKAGYRSTVDSKVLEAVAVERYQESSACITYTAAFPK